MVRALLLSAGIAAVGVYAVGDVVSGLLYDGYSFRDQAISELSAYGSPVRPLMVTVIAVHGLFGAAFGVGVWLAADGYKALRATAAFLLAAGVVTLPLHPFFPMSSRGMETGFNDTMHIILTMAFGFLVFGAVASSVVVYRGWFRLFAALSLAIITVFGALAGNAVQGIEEGLPTPGLGAFERVNAYVFFLWIVVLAATSLNRMSDGVQVPAEPAR